MTFSNLGINSAGTRDWLEAMKNQSSSGVEPSNTSGLGVTCTKEQIEAALKQAKKQVPSEPSTGKR